VLRTRRKSSMHRKYMPSLLSRRSVLGALSTVIPVNFCLAQDFTVNPSDAEKAARDFLTDLTAREDRGEDFWYLDRTFNHERDKLDRSNADAVVKLKQQWSAAIVADRRSKKLEIEAFSNDPKVQTAWEKRHPGFNYTDPSYPCWLVFRKGVQIESVTSGEKEANFDDEKLWIHVPLHYNDKNESPAVYDFDLQQDKRLRKASATLWVQKPNRNAHLYVYDECWLSDIEPWV
jgi:hypothetical protein